MNKGFLSNLFRLFRLMHFVDMLRYRMQKIENAKENKMFKISHPNVKLPDDYLMYESFRINYKKYFEDGKTTAIWLLDILNEHKNLKDIRMLDWGCGPGRIIRHLPELLGEKSEIFGTDYNKKSIIWCQKNLPGISFNQNGLEAKLPYNDNFFDVIYGISILTHLSEEKHVEWVSELSRILKPGGILFLTSHGKNFISKLTEKELEKFNLGKIIIRGNVKEGHRTYTAYHPKKFMLELFKKLMVLDHLELETETGKYPQQDIWILKK